MLVAACKEHTLKRLAPVTDTFSTTRRCPLSGALIVCCFCVAALYPLFSSREANEYRCVWLFTVVIYFNVQFLTAELNLFYLKFILWIPPPHFIMQVRMALFLGIGAVALNETFRYMDDP